jgi:hypothetical protein
MKPLLIKVQRDETFLKALDVELMKFCSDLAAVVAKIK